MVKAVIFDMYETLITHFEIPLYFGSDMARDMGVSEEEFLPRWRATEDDRTIGKFTTEGAIEKILQDMGMQDRDAGIQLEKAEELLNGVGLQMKKRAEYSNESGIQREETENESNRAGIQWEKRAEYSNESELQMKKRVEYSNESELQMKKRVEYSNESDFQLKELVNHVLQKRIEVKEDCFRHLHSEIIPMLEALKRQNIKVALISNCFSEEAQVIRRSILFPYFDEVFLSCEQGVKKPDPTMALRCLETLQLQPAECLYVGDGGSRELEMAEKLGMKAMQATWYLGKNEKQPVGRLPEYPELAKPLDILNVLR